MNRPVAALVVLLASLATSCQRSGPVASKPGSTIAMRSSEATDSTRTGGWLEQHGGVACDASVPQVFQTAVVISEPIAELFLTGGGLGVGDLTGLALDEGSAVRPEFGWAARHPSPRSVWPDCAEWGAVCRGWLAVERPGSRTAESV
jgi:hypothetical protein